MDLVNPEPREPVLCFAPTTDRWGLALHRYRQPDPAAPAVILCSGYGCNRHFVDFDERYSLARFLAREGFDTWVVELRGRGHSRPLRGCRQPNHWTFDDLAQIDVPTALAFVQHQMGHRRLCWVGHSMGGMVLYAYLGSAGEGVTPAATVTLGTPVTFPRLASELAHRLGTLLLKMPIADRVPQRPVLGALWHLVGWTSALDVGMNPHNVDRAVVGRMLRRSICNVSRAKLQQLASWSADGSFTSVDGSVDYRENLRRVTTPTLLVAGARDRLATPEGVALAHDLLASPNKRFLVLGKSEGLSVDYGHVDIVFGRRAPDEVFPLLGDWIRDALEAAEP